MKITRINGNLSKVSKGNEGELLEDIEKLLQNFEDIVKKQVEMIR